MASYIVTGARRRPSKGAHNHIEHLCTADGATFTRRQVVASLNAGDLWNIVTPDVTIRVFVVPFCPYPRCLVSPYLTTNANSSAATLESLPDC